ncbi:hypothetical protein L1049_027885 [Liquidambar formosana]|uniref:Uncharacterized protein n=1 Tax=Liquidambar formosana TaxID=63359 RepID=A0AAP0WW30_LIQFO
MRPQSNIAPVADDEIMNWHTPTPYFFCGLLVMFGVIGVASLIQSFSLRKPSSESWTRMSESSSGDTVEKPKQFMIAPADAEPKIVVIMAGDETPTYLANPVPSTPHGEPIL